MIWKIDPFWLFFSFMLVTMLSYLFGYFLDRILNRDGFGPVGNMIFLVAGFFGSIYFSNLYGIRFWNVQVAVAAGLAGSFAMLTVFYVLKALFYRTN